MVVAVTELTREDLLRRRNDLLRDSRLSLDELRERVRTEAATTAERATLATLDEIAFLLDDGQ